MLTDKIGLYNDRISNRGADVRGGKWNSFLFGMVTVNILNDYPNRLNTTHPSLTDIANFK